MTKQVRHDTEALWFQQQEQADSSYQDGCDASMDNCPLDHLPDDPEWIRGFNDQEAYDANRSKKS